MKVRFGEKLLSEMRAAELRHGVSYSEIARKALRKTRRLKIRIRRKKAETTYQGEAIRIDVKASEFPRVTPAEIRSAVAWYLSHQPAVPPLRPVDDGGLIEGVDYKVASIH